MAADKIREILFMLITKLTQFF